MLDESIATTVGQVNENVTHWGISRLEKGKPQRLETPNDAGVSVREWPLDDLTVENLRARYGAGEYRCHWFQNDPDNDEPSKRHISQGHSRVFRLEPETASAVVAPPAAGLPSAVTQSGASLAELLQFMTALTQASDARAERSISAIATLAGLGGHSAPAAPAPDAALMARLSTLETQLAVANAVNAANEAARAREEELQRRIRRLEEEANAADNEVDMPMIQPGAGGILEQLGVGILNAAAKNPELAARVLTPIVAPVISALAPSATPPAQAPSPVLAQPAPAPQQAAPRPAPAEDGSINNLMPQSPIEPTPRVRVPVVGANGVVREASAPAPEKEVTA